MSTEPLQLLPTRQVPDTYPARKGLVEASLITIRTGLMYYFAKQERGEVKDNETLEGYNLCSRSRVYATTGFIAVKGGFVLQKVTQGGLADYSHRLKVPTEGSEPNYHRDAFNIDAQAIVPKPINLTGIAEISKNPDAVIETLCFERDVLYYALTGWQGTAIHSVPSAAC